MYLNSYLIKKILLLFLIMSSIGCSKEYAFDRYSKIYANDGLIKKESNGKNVFVSVSDADSDGFYTEEFWCNPHTKFVPPILIMGEISKKGGGNKIPYDGNYESDFYDFITSYLRLNGFTIIEDKNSADHVVSIQTKRHCSYLSGYDYVPSGLDAKLLYSYNSVFHAIIYIDGNKYEYASEAIQKNSYIQEVTLVPFPFGNKQWNEFVSNSDTYIDDEKIASSRFYFANDGGAIMAVPIVGEYVVNSSGSIDIDGGYTWNYGKDDYVVNWGHSADITLNKSDVDDRMLWATEATGALNVLYRNFAKMLIEYL